VRRRGSRLACRGWLLTATTYAHRVGRAGEAPGALEAYRRDPCDVPRGVVIKALTSVGPDFNIGEADHSSAAAGPGSSATAAGLAPIKAMGQLCRCQSRLSGVDSMALPSGWQRTHRRAHGGRVLGGQRKTSGI
jgi:hypothetical protein